MMDNVEIHVSIKQACVPYRFPEFADELSVVVMRFDDSRLAAGHMRGTFNKIGPQGTLGQENLFGLQIHLSYNFVCHLWSNGIQNVRRISEVVNVMYCRQAGRLRYKCDSGQHNCTFHKTIH